MFLLPGSASLVLISLHDRRMDRASAALSTISVRKAKENIGVYFECGSILTVKATPKFPSLSVHEGTAVLRRLSDESLRAAPPWEWQTLASSFFSRLRPVSKSAIPAVMILFSTRSRCFFVGRKLPRAFPLPILIVKLKWCISLPSTDAALIRWRRLKNLCVPSVYAIFIFCFMLSILALTLTKV